MSARMAEPSLGPSTFAELYGRHHQGLLAFFMRRTFDAEVSVDLVAETFAQAFSGRRRFRGTTRDAEAALLYTVARRLLSRYYRHGRAERDALERHGVARAQLDDESLARIEELAGVATMRGLIGEHVRALSLEHREALALRVVAVGVYREFVPKTGLAADRRRRVDLAGGTAIAHSLCETDAAMTASRRPRELPV